MDWLKFAFQLVFSLAVIVFCLAVVMTFLLLVKLLFMFFGDFDFLGINFSPVIR